MVPDSAILNIDIRPWATTYGLIVRKKTTDLAMKISSVNFQSKIFMEKDSRLYRQLFEIFYEVRLHNTRK